MGLQIGGWLLMKKYDLLRSGDNIVRVLDIQQERVFVIECINRKMPVWMESELLESYVRSVSYTHLMLPTICSV